ncbi:MAG: DUF2335 domain-containing protein [Kiritimatiellia bacterium]
MATDSQSVKPSQTVVAASATQVKAQLFNGPIPPPSVLAEYENNFPGFAERILAMAEREAQTRHELERKNSEVAARDIKDARAETRRGQWMSFFITTGAFASAVYCAVINQPWVAGIIAGATLVSVVSTIMNRGGTKK